MKISKKRVWMGLAVAALFFSAFEGALRAGAAFRWKWLANPDWYRDWTTDEDYWKLRHLWIQRVTASSDELYDPFLGWSTPKTPTNPLGATAKAPYLVETEKPALLFVGDSFVRGANENKTRLPDLVSAELGGMVSYNLAERGYGWDQEYLRYQEARKLFKEPIVVAGLLSVGMDRAVLRFRTGLKPYFAWINGQVQLRGVPVPKDADRWVEENPPKLGLYSWAFLTRKWQILRSKNPLEVTAGRQYKEQVNAALLENWAADVKALRHRMVFVLFFNKEELSYQGWREEFLVSTLNRIGAPYINTKELLLSQSRDGARFYLPSGTLNDDGNRLVAKAIVQRLRGENPNIRVN